MSIIKQPKTNNPLKPEVRYKERNYTDDLETLQSDIIKYTCFDQIYMAKIVAFNP